MNCLHSEEVRAQNLQNKRLERKLQVYKRKYNKQIKLLLLGTIGCGKSTFIRQMRFAQQQGHSIKDRMKYIGIIQENIISAMQTMIDAMQALAIRYETKENALENSIIIKYVDLNVSARFTDVVWVLKELWADAGIQECYMRGQEYDQPDSTKYFFNNIDRIASPHYMPNDQDILRARVHFNGFEQHIFKCKNVEFLITDVGGQRSGRKKWIHCFDNATAIIFMIAVSEYDQYTIGCERHNRLKESLELLKSIACYEFFEDVAFILVFNKFDILEEKIMYSHLVNYFPEYKGPQYDPRAALGFISQMFLKLIPSNRRKYHYFLSAIDLHSQSLIFVYTAVRDSILSANLYNFNLV